MPKDEFDFEDPFELNGMSLLTHEDTTTEMAECFIEEFMRMGYGPKQLLAVFRNPHYLGPNMALEKRGEPFIRDLIVEVFARRGRAVIWNDCGTRDEEAGPSRARGNECLPTGGSHASQTSCDPMGAPVPELNL